MHSSQSEILFQSETTYACILQFFSISLDFQALYIINLQNFQYFILFYIQHILWESSDIIKTLSIKNYAIQL